MAAVTDAARTVAPVSGLAACLVGECLHCGYDLTGNVGGLCPECRKPK